MKKIILIGAGGHCKSCIDIIERIPNIKINVILDKKNNINNLFQKYKVYKDDEIEKKKYQNNLVLITVGQIKNSLLRKKLFNRFSKKGFKFISILSKNSTVSKYSKINDGNIIMNYSYIGPNVEIGKNCIINNYASVEHDSIIGDHCHISTGVKINGNCKIGEGTFIGSGTILNNNVSIGKNCIISSGLTIKKDITDNKLIK